MNRRAEGGIFLLKIQRAKGPRVPSVANWRQAFEGLWSRGPSRTTRLHLILPFDTTHSKIGPFRGTMG